MGYCLTSAKTSQMGYTDQLDCCAYILGSMGSNMARCKIGKSTIEMAAGERNKYRII